MRVLTSVLLCLMLVACGLPEGRDKPLVVTDQNLLLAVPDGFCHDATSSTIGARQAFVVYGSCAAINGAEGPPTPIATIGVILGQEMSSPDELVSYLESDAGRALLSRQDEAGDIEITSTAKAPMAVYLRVTDTGDGNIAGFAQDYWRAYVTRPDATFAVTLRYPLPGLSNPQMGLDMLASFVGKLSAPARNTSNPFAENGVVGRLLN